MTTQMQPLNVGVPLYPFSRTSLYDPTFQPSHEELIDAGSSEHNSELQVSSLLAGRTGERLRSGTMSHIGSPPRSPMPPHTHSLPESGNLMDDYSSLGLGTGGFGSDMISAQGIWKPAQYDPMQHLQATVASSSGVMGGVSGVGATNIFEELGL